MKQLRKSFLLFITLTLVACGASTQRKNPLTNKTNNSIRVASYNVNWHKDSWQVTKAQQTINAIRRTHADIILLQETTPFWEHQLNLAFAQQYPYRQFLHHPNAGGLAVMSKYPVSSKKYLRPRFGWHPIWLFNVSTPLGNWQFLNLHLTPSLVSEGNPGLFGYAVLTTPSIRKKEIRTSIALLTQKKRVIIAGDFNESNHGPVTNYLYQHGFTDAFAVRSNYASTWRYRAGLLNFNGRFDRVFYSADLTAHNAQVLKAGNSDHYPVVVDIAKK